MIIIRQYAAGEVIYKEGDEGGTAYFIDQGKVEVTKTLDSVAIRLSPVSFPVKQTDSLRPDRRTSV